MSVARSPSRAEVLVVTGAGGGVGASTLAALLAAQRARAGQRVVLLDLDPARGGMEVLLGLEGEPGARWADLAGVRGALAASDLDGVLPRWGRVELLGGDRRAVAPDPATVESVLGAVAEQPVTVVVDLPARAVLTDLGRGPAGPVLAARDDLLLVAGQDVLGVAAALAVRPELGGPAHLVLRRRRRSQVAPLEAAHLLDLPLLALLPTDRRLADATERGLGPVLGRWSAMARAVRRVAEGVGRA